MAVNNAASVPVDYSGRAEMGYLMDRSTGSFREKFGTGLFTEDQKRLAEYRDAQIAAAQAKGMNRLEMIKADRVENFEEATELNTEGRTGFRPNLSARSHQPGFTVGENYAHFAAMTGRIRG